MGNSLGVGLDKEIDTTMVHGKKNLFILLGARQLQDRGKGLGHSRGAERQTDRDRVRHG